MRPKAIAPQVYAEVYLRLLEDDYQACKAQYDKAKRELDSVRRARKYARYIFKRGECNDTQRNL